MIQSVHRDQIFSCLQKRCYIVITGIVPLINDGDRTLVQKQFVSGVRKNPNNSAGYLFFQREFPAEKRLFNASSPDRND